MFDLKYCNWNKDMLMGVLPNSQFGDVAVIDISNTGDSNVVLGSATAKSTVGIASVISSRLLQFRSLLCRPLLLTLFLQVLLFVLICLLCNLNSPFLRFARLKRFSAGKKSVSPVIPTIVNK